MGTQKRKLSSLKTTSPGKRVRRHSQEDVIVIDDDDEDDLDTILARIKEQERSEALARQLQDEWNSGASTSTTHNLNASSREVIVIDDSDDDDNTANEWRRETRNVDASPVCVPLDKCSSGRAGGSSYDQDTPPDEALAQFRDFFIADKDCSKCGEAIAAARGHVMFSAASTPPPTLLVLLHAYCSACRTNHCRGCSKPVACSASCKGPSRNPKCAIQTCCAEVRAIAVFETLGGFDRHYLTERATSELRAQLAMEKRKQTGNSRSVGPGGTGYGMGSDGGRGRARATQKTSQRDQKASRSDDIVVRALNTLTAFLPSPYSDSAQVYDMLPHASIGYLLSISQLPELLASLLRNDSVTDWISRSDVYQAMIYLLRRMADCELTVEVLIAPQWKMKKSCGLEDWMWEDGEIVWEMKKDDGKIVERAPPLYEHFKKLTKQCQAFLTGTSRMMDDGHDEDIEDTVVKGMSLCGDIIAARDDMERAMTIMGKAPSLSNGNDGVSSNSHNKGKGRDVSVDVEKLYADACERYAFQHVMLAELLSPNDKGEGNSSVGGLSYSNYNYAQELRNTDSETRHPKDRLHLIKELAVMATSLPPGVWVRVDEIRNDVIKIMIAGPDGTPYAGGLFEFDCFMPIQYPNKPPLLHLRTTGGGTVRFNPNLYNNGKVCLSLLGTWPGRPEEQWSPKSTLLQVLVSIQSMILIDTPYYNEPGHGQANPNAPVSITYNIEVSFQTLRWAILGWFKDEHRHGIWADVIASHFTIRKDQIRSRILEWAAKDPRIRGRQGAMDRRGHDLGISQPGASWKGGDLVEEYDRGLQTVQHWLSA